MVKWFTICEFCLFAYFLILILKNKVVINLIKWSIPIFIILAVSYYFIIYPGNFSIVPSITEFLFFISAIVYFFYEKMKTVIMYPLYQSIIFWICVAFFLYFTGNFFYILFSNTSTDRGFNNQLTFVYGVVTIAKDLLLCFALFANEPKEQNGDILNIPTEMDLDNFTPTNPKNE